ncbi:hypothetical protein MBANPS3_002647 [Mucor bainieri]
MPPYLLLNDTNAVKRLILEQAKQIECLKRQLEEYERDDLTETASVSSSLVCNASATPTLSASIASGITSDSIVTGLSARNDQSLSTSPALKSEEYIEVPSSSPRSSTPQQRRIPPLQKIARPPRKKELQLNQLPSKRTFKKRMKAAIELDGYNRDAHFQHLIYQDSTLPSSTKNARWNFAFRFCSYFVLSGKKIFVKTLIHGNKGDNKKTSIDSFPGLRAFWRLKRIDAALLEKPLSEETVAHFTITQHQVEIVKFMYAFCSLLYAFLPQEKRVYKVKSNISDFYLSAKPAEQEIEEEEETEVKVEVDSDSEFVESGLKAERNHQSSATR